MKEHFEYSFNFLVWMNKTKSRKASGEVSGLHIKVLYNEMSSLVWRHYRKFCNWDE